ncbi:diguanylate cyclase [Uliginosibacterium sp. H3]|uniref:Diguanylate cyclase n=1 Tax=Uliginosibacterium silvisoli TaxID=3114758 RepID=A0ABU6K0R5_9RHOO|nr:diguanylate cyclase [Uliginosibacterium sp. H3]
MRRALEESLIVAIVGFGLGALVFRLTGQVWMALPVCAIGATLPLCWLRRRDDSNLREAGRRAAAERDQHEATQQFIQRLLDVVPMPIYVKDADSRIIIVNRAQADQWGQPREAVIGTHSFAQAPDAARTRVSLAEDKQVLDGERIYKEEHSADGPFGQEQYRVISKARCEDSDGSYVIVCARFDITKWRQAEREIHQALEREVLLRQRNQEFIQRVIDVIPDPFYIKDRNGRLVMVNEVFAAERGRTPESMLGMQSTAVALSPELSLATASEDAAVLRGEIIDKEQHYIVPRTGEERFRLVSKRPCVDMDGQPVIVVAHINITRWKIAERKLARMAHEDELTGLPNRRRFFGEAERMISAATRHSKPLSLIIFDLDYFKLINDEHGHVIGDQVLREVANRLLEQLRNEDLPCRWGGEEFLILMPMTDLSMAMPLAERLREAFASAPIVVSNLSLAVTVSGGVAQKRDDESLNECLARADKALYAAKNGGRNQFLSA